MKEQKIDAARKLDKNDNTLLQVKTDWICEYSGKALQEHNIRSYYPYSDRKVYFTSEDMKAIKTVAPPGLTLLGFKPVDAILPEYNIKNPYFLYPDEDAYPGSNAAFLYVGGAS